MSIQEKLIQSLERLGKWRAIFAGWQLGTRPKGDPESDAVRHHRESTIMQRAELNAQTRLLLDKGVFTLEEFQTQLREEADHLSKEFETLFPGFRASDDGMIMTMPEAQETTKGWRS